MKEYTYVRSETNKIKSFCQNEILGLSVQIKNYIFKVCKHILRQKVELTCPKRTDHALKELFCLSFEFNENW